MGLLGPLLNHGHTYADIILHDAITFPDEADITVGAGIELQFFSPTGEFVGLVGTSFDKANLTGLQIVQKKNKDVEKASFSITRLTDIPFYNQMECRAFINGNWWFSWELLLKPNEDRSDPEYVYEGKGWSYYMDVIKVTKLYENKTLEFILQDLISDDVANNTPVLYNPALINPPSYTVTKLELKKKTVRKALQEVLKIANVDYQNEQYRWGVNKEKQFFFEEIGRDVERGFFEGYDYQEPDVKENLKSVVNQIDIYRAVEDSQDVTFVSRVEDAESQGLYGIRNKDITLSDFVDTTTAERIATAIIERFKDPLIEISAEDLRTEDNPYNIGFFNINNKRFTYTDIINEFENLSDWTVTAPNTTITETQEKVLSGKKSFKIVTTANSSGDQMEYELPEQINFPTSVSMYFSQSAVGEAFTIELEDEDGNTISTNDSSIILLEDGGQLLLEDGGGIAQEALTSGIESKLLVDFQKITLSATGLDNIKKVRILFVASSVFTLYLDRLEAFSNTYKQNTLTIDKIEYRQEGNSIRSNIIFGEEIDNVINDIKKLDDKAINTINIFQKS